MSDHSTSTSDRDGRIDAALEGSYVAHALEPLRARIVAPLRARTTAASRGLATLVRGSFCYRWLTTEPDPAVVVIDLRETWTIGPVVRLLDRIVDVVEPIWRHSRLKDGCDAIGRVGSRVADTRVGAWLATVLEPPEPPEDSDEFDDQQGPPDDPKG